MRAELIVLLVVFPMVAFMWWCLCAAAGRADDASEAWYRGAGEDKE